MIAVAVAVITLVLLACVRKRQRKKGREVGEKTDLRPKPFVRTCTDQGTSVSNLLKNTRSQQESAIPYPAVNDVAVPPTALRRPKNLQNLSHPSSEDIHPSNNPPSATIIREINHEDSGVRIPSLQDQEVREIVVEHPPPYTAG